MENFTCDFVAKNHAIINLPNKCKAYCSYNRIVAFKAFGKIWLTEYYNYSATTTKHLNKMLNITNKELKDGVENGKYPVVNDITEIILRNI